jgi:cell division protein FtsL
MSQKSFLKVDKFYAIFALTIIAVGFLVVFTFRTIFSAIRNSYDIESQVTESELRINKDNLDKALNAFDNRNIVPLEIR